MLWTVNEQEEAQILQEVSGAELMTTTRDLAHWVRLSGSAEELESFRYVETKLQSYGYKTQLMFHEGYISLPGPASLEVTGQGKIDCITHAFAAPTPSTGTHGEVVYVPSPSEAQPAQVQGKIVLVDGMASGTTTLILEQLGAVAQVYIHDDHLHESSVSPRWGSPTDQTIKGFPTTPGISIRRADGQRLKHFLEDSSVRAIVHAEVDTGWRQIPLLTADLPGLLDKYVLFSSHIDSWHYGAMDNGSANATVLEVVRLMSKRRQHFKQGLRLAFWSGHSHGRFCGSAWYADQYWHDLYQNCVAHVYCDSTGGVNASIVTEPPVMPETKDVASSALKRVTGEELVGKRIGRFADQSFYGIGLPAIFGTFSEQDVTLNPDVVSFKTGGKRGGGLGWWWHTPEDTVDKVDEANLVRDTKVYASLIFRLLNTHILPFNYREVAEDLARTLEDLAQIGANAFDLSQARAIVAELTSVLDVFYQLIEAKLHQDEADEAWIAVANSTMIAIARHLVPINFHEEGRFEHDEAAPLQPIPALQPIKQLVTYEPHSSEFLMLATRLKRRSNWIVYELRRAVQEVTSGVSALKNINN